MHSNDVTNIPVQWCNIYALKSQKHILICTNNISNDSVQK